MLNTCKCEESYVPWRDGIFDIMFDGNCRRCGKLIEFVTFSNEGNSENV
jgi:hypothetical protein